MLEPDQLRALVQDCIGKHLYPTAVFYADKLVTLTDYAPGDVYLLAQVQQPGMLLRNTALLAVITRSSPCAVQTYFVSRQHRRGVMLLRQHGLLDDLRFRYLTAKCLAEVGEWDEVLSLLGDSELDEELAEQVTRCDVVTTCYDGR